MTNLVVISFSNESQAIEGSHKLIELESFGDITVYEKVIVKKDGNGTVTVLQTETTDGLRTLSGMALGTLIGALAGPVGMMVGLATGTIAGAALEADHFDFADDFGTNVTTGLKPGTVAILAEIYEEGPAFVDNALEPLGATISRSNVDYVYDEYVDKQIQDVDEEIAEERAKLKSNVAADKAKIQQKISQLKEKRRRRIAELKEKQKTAIAKIKAPLAEAKKSRLVNRIYNHQQRIEELQGKLKEMEH